jgi:hypothetical protein
MPDTSSVCYLLDAGFLLGLVFNPEDGGNVFLKGLIFTGLRGIISQKIGLFKRS